MRIVLTGGPGIGKTAILSELDERGFPILEEVARKVIERVGPPNGSRERVRELQQHIVSAQLQQEADNPHHGKYQFLDRSLIDNIGYCNHYRNEVPEELSSISDLQTRYDFVFLLDQLPYKKDAQRTEDEATARAIHQRIAEAYQSLGYNPIRVPVNLQLKEKESIQERTEFILKRVKEHEQRNRA